MVNKPEFNDEKIPPQLMSFWGKNMNRGRIKNREMLRKKEKSQKTKGKLNANGAKIKPERVGE